jgi:hypothetical protein
VNDDPRRAAAMWTLAVDSVTAEAMAAFQAAGVGAVLLKGPTIADWLYDGPAERPYVDSDVLVDPAAVERAHAVLRELGFGAEFGPLPHTGMERPPSYPWRREAFVLDLHETLPGAGAPPRDVWAAVRGDSSERDVGGRRVQALGRHGVLTAVALHAAHHGQRVERPLEDLARAVARAGEEDWAAAAELARRIGAETAFANGLGMTREGRDMLARLGLQTRHTAEWRLEADGVPLAAGIERLARAGGVRARAAMLRDELFPSPEFMRWWTPMVRGSWPGLPRAYLWRWLYLARGAPAAVRARSRYGRSGV